MPELETTRRIVELAPGAMVLWSRTNGDLCCEAISRRLAQVDGISVEEHLGRSPLELLPELGADVTAAINSVFDTGQSCVVDINGPTPSSPVPERSFRAEYAPVHSEDGTRVELVVGVVEETTPLVRTHARLQLLDASGDLLGSTLDEHRTLDELADMLVSSISDFAIIRVAPAHDAPDVFLIRHRTPAVERQLYDVVATYPMAPDSPIGPPAVIATGRPELLADFAAVRSLFAGSAEHEQALTNLGAHTILTVPLTVGGRTTGAITLGRIEQSTPFDEDDVATMVDVARRAGLAVDNARVHARVARLSSAADALDQLDEGVVMLDDRGVVQRINLAAESMLGVAREDALDRHSAEVAPSLQQMVESAVDVEPGEQTIRAEPIRFPEQPEERWMSVNRTRGDAGTIYMLHDVTANRRLELLTSEFVSTVSHELRTPLTVLQGAGQTLLDLGPAIDRATRERLLRSIVAQSHRLGRIIGEILVSQQLDAGSVAIFPRHVDVRDLVRSTISELRSIVSDGVVIRSEIPSGRCSAWADPDALRHILDNLLDNAIRYSPSRGHVSVVVRSSNEMLEVEVSDEGIGIPYIERERIFDKFARLDPQLRHFKSSTGLGLYVSRKLARCMGGDVTVRSRPGPGSTFVVAIPVAEPARSRSAARTA